MTELYRIILCSSRLFVIMLKTATNILIVKNNYRNTILLIVRILIVLSEHQTSNTPPNTTIAKCRLLCCYPKHDVGMRTFSEFDIMQELYCVLICKDDEGCMIYKTYCYLEKWQSYKYRMSRNIFVINCKYLCTVTINNEFTNMRYLIKVILY